MNVVRLACGTVSVLTLLIAATPSLASSATTLSGAPNPSLTNQAVTITATTTSASPNTACSVSVTDTTNTVAICSGPIAFNTDASGTGIGTCSHTFTTPGPRTIGGTITGCATSGVGSYSQIVNAAAITVPTMAEWSLWGLTGALLLGGAALVARRTRGM